MSSYHELEFAPLFITDVFETIKAAGKWFDLSKARIYAASTIPYVARSGGGNGIGTFLPHQGFDAPNSGNAITIGVSTSTVFYQPVDFYTSKEIQVLRHPNLNAENGLILVSILREQMRKFAWGNGASLDRLKATRIMVPVATGTAGEQIVDWNGMTSLGEELMAAAVTHTHSARTTNIHDADADLPDLRFEPMFITDVFDTMKASSAWYDKIKLRTTGDASYPFVSRTKVSNGVDGFSVRQEKAPERGNALTIGLDTQTIAYQPVPFYTSQNIQVLRHPHLNQEAALVLAACIRAQMGKFSWGGNGATLGRLKVTRIMVPIATDPTGEQVIDWEGMTRYGQVVRARAERDLSLAVDGG